MNQRPPTLKPKDGYRDHSPAYKAKRRRAYARMMADCARAILLPGPERPPAPAPLFAPRPIEPRALGMNLCPSPDPRGDAIQIETLGELGVGAVRIDYGQRADRAPADRLLDALSHTGLPITLHLVQDPRDASAMADSGPAAAQWRAFVEQALDKWGHAIEALEAGSTPNRHSWSGYTPADYARAAKEARQAIDAWSAADPGRATPLLLGPNISDFAPYFTVTQLAECRRQGVTFDVMSDNLFIDRVGEPEAWDPHVLGRRLRALARMDMVGKQRFLAAIGRRYGAPRAWCTYTHYTLNFGRERRRYVSEDQYADYMTRLHLLSLTAGRFERVYWGTLVSHYKGLIDEGLGVRPYPPFVHHRYAIDAPPEQWRRRETFLRAYAAMAQRLAGARFVARRLPAPGAIVLEFENDRARWCAGWTRDAMRFDYRPPAEPTAVFRRDGEALATGEVVTLGPSPVYWQGA